MRFFTFVALMLPLSALAAPTSTPPQPAPNDLTKKLNDAREQFSAALGETSLAVNKTIAQLEKDPKQGALLTKAKAVNDQLEIAFIAGLNIQNAIQGFTPVQEQDQLKVAQGTITAQTILKGLDEDVRQIRGKGKNNGKNERGFKIDLKQLQINVCGALVAATEMVQAGVRILALQEKTVRQLFENAGLDIPPGF